MRIRKGDNVIMLSGKDKGKKGKVARIVRVRQKVIIEGLNLLTKHAKPRREGEKGQTIKIPRQVPVSTVMLVCPKCSKPTRVGISLTGDKKERVCKKCLRTF